jgi:hypothetical protein
MTTKTRSWTDAFEDQPAGTEDKRRGDDRIRDFKEDTRQRMTEEHFFGPDDPIASEGASGVGGGLDNDDPPSVGTNADLEGRHREGSARCHRITAAEVEPTTNANHSFGRLLVKEGMSTGTPAGKDDGLFVGDAAAGFDRVPIGIDNMTASAVAFGAMVRKMEVLNSATAHTVNAAAYAAIPINGAATSYAYTNISPGNQLLVLHNTPFSAGTGAVNFVMAARFDTTTVDEATANTGSFRIQRSSSVGDNRFHSPMVVGLYTIPALAVSVTVEIVALRLAGSLDLTLDSGAVPVNRRTIIVEFGTS